MRRLAIAGLSIMVGAAVLLLDPMGVWEEDAPAFAFDDVDMRIAVEGSWELTLARNTQTRTLHFSVVQATQQVERVGRGRDLVRPANACSQRTLVRSAAACLDTTTMPLEIVALDPEGVAIDGELHVFGHRWEHGRFALAIGDIFVDAEITPQGRIERVSAVEGRHRLEPDRYRATLRRIAK
jgi:hypothetical protein